ncbi:MAG: hypothetical protein V1870_04275 [Candidatus Aenigmatarchaeota archaeon]
MKKIVFLIIISMLFLVGSVNAVGVALAGSSDIVQLKVGEIGVLKDGTIIKLIDLKDQRCPVGAMCFIAGNVVLNFDITKDGYTLKNLSTTSSNYWGFRVFDYRINADVLSPVDNSGLDKSNYVIKFSVVNGSVPSCQNIGTELEGWYDDKGLIKYANCSGQNIVCKNQGMDTEGWYSSNGSLIKYEQCSYVVCNDGTLYGSCSLAKPKYCDNGKLIVSCNRCSCDPGMECNAIVGVCQISTPITVVECNAIVGVCQIPTPVTVVECNAIVGVCQIPTPVTVVECKDSDGGKNYVVAGNTTIHYSDDVWYGATDKCENNITLLEASCPSSGSEDVYERYNCPNGCRDGACINTTPLVNITQNCVDSDGGWNLNVAGSVSMTGLGIVCSDRCGTNQELINSGGKDSLFECFCGNKTGFGGGQGSGWVGCPNGCRDGACVVLINGRGVNLYKGWNIMSVPFSNPSIADNRCNISIIYHYNSLTKKYDKVDDIKNMRPGLGYWVRVADDCMIAYDGTFPVTKNDLGDEPGRLKKGWNMIGGFNGGIYDSGCVIKVIFDYDGVSKSFRKVDVLASDKGYWVYVKDDCSLMNNDENNSVTLAWCYASCLPPSGKFNIGSLVGKGEISLDECKNLVLSNKNHIDKQMCANSTLKTDNINITWNGMSILSYMIDCNHTCSDSEFVINIFTKGIVLLNGTYGLVSFEDVCTNSTHYRDFYCNGTEWASGDFDCPNGCVNGACVAGQAKISVVRRMPVNTTIGVNIPVSINIQLGNSIYFVLDEKIPNGLDMVTMPNYCVYNNGTRKISDPADLNKDNITDFSELAKRTDAFYFNKFVSVTDFSASVESFLNSGSVGSMRCFILGANLTNYNMNYTLRANEGDRYVFGGQYIAKGMIYPEFVGVDPSGYGGYVITVNPLVVYNLSSFPKPFIKRGLGNALIVYSNDLENKTAMDIKKRLDPNNDKDILIKHVDHVTSADKATRHLILIGNPCTDQFIMDLANVGRLTRANGSLIKTCDDWSNINMEMIGYVKDGFASGKDVLIITSDKGLDDLFITKLSGYVVEFSTLPPGNPCNPGTSYELAHGACLGSKPYYCNNGTYVYNCGVCGCPDNNYICNKTGGKCVMIRCGDGTEPGQCSKTVSGTMCIKSRNYYYLSGNCSVCGCLSPYEKCSSYNKRCLMTRCSDGTLQKQCSVVNKGQRCMAYKCPGCFKLVNDASCS